MPASANTAPRDTAPMVLFARTPDIDGVLCSAAWAMSLVLFDRLITEQAVIPHYQPIVNLRSSAIEGHEVLCRSRLTGLETPIQMFSAATQLDHPILRPG